MGIIGWLSIISIIACIFLCPKSWAEKLERGFEKIFTSKPVVIDVKKIGERLTKKP